MRIYKLLHYLLGNGTTFARVLGENSPHENGDMWCNDLLTMLTLIVLGDPFETLPKLLEWPPFSN